MTEQISTPRLNDLDGLRRAVMAHAIGPYLLTVTERDRPHVGDASCSWQDSELLVPAPSSWPGSLRSGHLGVSLLWPPNEPGGYSLIVDGQARPVPSGLAITITRAVHYQPSSSPGDESCGADCIPIFPR